MPIAASILDVQHDLFDLGGELSIPGHAAITEAHVERLEAAVERFNADLPPLKEFILPGGTRAASLAHIARTVCRRAERALVRLAATEQVSDFARKYLNRLSDLLFVLARVINRAEGQADVLWRRDAIASALRADGSADPARPLERNARLMDLLARTALSDQQAFAELYRLTLVASVCGRVAYIEGVGRCRGGAAGKLRQYLAPRRIVRRREKPAADVADEHRAQSLPGSFAPPRNRHGHHRR